MNTPNTNSPSPDRAPRDEAALDALVDRLLEAPVESHDHDAFKAKTLERIRSSEILREERAERTIYLPQLAKWGTWVGAAAAAVLLVWNLAIQPSMPSGPQEIADVAVVPTTEEISLIAEALAPAEIWYELNEEDAELFAQLADAEWL